MALYRVIFLVLSVVALILTWWNNILFAQKTLPQRHPQITSTFELMIQGFSDFFTVDSRTNKVVSFIFDSVNYLFIGSSLCVLALTCRIHQKSSIIRFFVEMIVYIMGAMGIAVSFAFPLFCGLHASVLFNNSPKQIRSVPTTSLLYLISLVTLVGSFGTLIAIWSLFLPLVPTVFSFQSLQAFQHSMIQFVNQSMDTYVSASLAWDLLVIAIAMSLFMVLHFSSTYYSLSFASVSVLLVLLSLVNMLTGGAFFCFYMCIHEAKCLSTQPSTDKKKA